MNPEPSLSDTPEALAAEKSDPSPAEPGIQRTGRKQLLRRVVSWVDDTLAAEEPPSGLAAEFLAGPQENPESFPGPGPVSGAAAPDDLFSLWSAMTALTQEVKLQGRQFQRLAEALSSLERLPDTVADALRGLREAREEAKNRVEAMREERDEREREIICETRKEAQREILEVLLDMRDRLTRGRELAEANLAKAETEAGAATGHLPAIAPPPRASWLRRKIWGDAPPVPDPVPSLSPLPPPPAPSPPTRLLAETVQALRQGYKLSLERLEDLLQRYGVQEIPCLGEVFDPATMKAVDISETEDGEDGVVVEVFRPGYEWNGRVFRAVEVKVTRSPVARSRMMMPPEAAPEDDVAEEDLAEGDSGGVDFTERAPTQEEGGAGEAGMGRESVTEAAVSENAVTKEDAREETRAESARAESVIADEAVRERAATMAVAPETGIVQKEEVT